MKIDYYYLKLRQYLISCHLEKRNDIEFINHRAEDAALAFEAASKAGKTVEESIEMADNVLFSGLHFSPYLFIKNILNEDFHEDREEVILSVLPQVSPIIAKYHPGDDFMGNADYGRCRLEIIGIIEELLPQKQ